jgi:hypothetical protein
VRDTIVHLFVCGGIVLVYRDERCEVITPHTAGKSLRETELTPSGHVRCYHLTSPHRIDGVGSERDNCSFVWVWEIVLVFRDERCEVITPHTAKKPEVYTLRR